MTTEQTTEQQQTRQTRYADVLAAHPEHEGPGGEVPSLPEGRYVLVQRTRAGSYWIDQGDDLAELVREHDADQYAEDWPVEYALDLDTGERYRVAGIRTETSMELDD